MKWNSLALNVVVAATVVVAQPATGIAQTPRENSEARRLYNEGVLSLYDGNYVEAERMFRESLNKYPKSDQAQKTSFALIEALAKLRRVQDARTEIEKFKKNFPNSAWMDDVNEKAAELGGKLNPPGDACIWNGPAELKAAQALADFLRGARLPDGPKKYGDGFPSNPSMSAQILRMLIGNDTQAGIEEARAMLKVNPSDPAVAANLGTIANSDSPLAMPFLLGVWGNAASSPNMRHNAFFWFGRMNPDKEEVAKAIMDLLARRETQPIGSEALYLMTVADHRAVLDKIVNSSNPEKFAHMDKIYQNGSVLLRTDLLRFVGRLNDPRSVPFLVEAAQNDQDGSVRVVAAQELGRRKDVDTATLQRLLRSQQTPPARAPQTQRFQEAPGSGSGLGSGIGSGLTPLSTFPPIQP